MPLWSEAIDAVLSTGVSLAPIGSSNWALNRNDALAAVDKLYAMKVPILGGDVYRLENGDLIFDYGGWYSDQEASESSGAFVVRSWRETKTYIEEYPLKTALFVIVPGVGESFLRH
jgi:hypothetical protein